MNEVKKTKYDKLVGRVGNEYHFCDGIFEYKDGMCRATGTILVPVSREEYEDRTDPEGDYVRDMFLYHWQELVQSGNTEEGFKEWIENVLRWEGDEAIFDFSGYDLWEQLRKLGMSEEDYPVFECVGCGRCLADTEFDEVYDKELLKKIIEIENKDRDRHE